MDNGFSKQIRNALLICSLPLLVNCTTHSITSTQTASGIGGTGNVADRCGGIGGTGSRKDECDRPILGPDDTKLPKILPQRIQQAGGNQILMSPFDHPVIIDMVPTPIVPAIDLPIIDDLKLEIPKPIEIIP